MMTIDTLLLDIVNSTTSPMEKSLSTKDAKVLRDLATIVNSHYLTENQGNLIIKILRENTKKLSNFSEKITESLTTPVWSRDFRQIRQVRKFHIGKMDDDTLQLIVEFTFNAEIRRILQEMSKKINQLIMVENGKKYFAPLTEKNIELLVDILTPHNFEIDELIQSHYKIIKSWSKSEVERQFLLTNIEHKNFQKAITDDLGIETSIDQHIINDRSMRYQYFIENTKNHGESLTEYLANRSKPRIWVDKNQSSMAEVIASVLALKRLPLLVVFDTLANNKYLENIKILSDALEENGIFDKIGVYFRLTNDDTGKQFNQYIADKSYNYQLDNTTNVACVMSGKLPKFFLKNAWKPMSVIALDSRMGMRHGKTAVYSSCCDLIVEWADEQSAMDLKVIGK
jgi:hypothetical protein